MPTIINNPNSTSGDSGGWGFVVGILILVVLVILFFVYAWPSLQNNNVEKENPDNTLNVEVNSPVVSTQPNNNQ